MKIVNVANVLRSNQPNLVVLEDINHDQYIVLGCSRQFWYGREMPIGGLVLKHNYYPIRVAAACLL